jgi:O-antigen/teichoic acid export membrane protein
MSDAAAGRPGTLGRRRLTRDVAWNLAGNAAPLVAALACIPFLVRGLGTERFGFLMVAWALVGYFNLFDFGVSRALTRLVAARIAAREHAGIGAAIGSGLALITGLGVIGGAALFAAAPWLCARVLSLPDPLLAEATTGVRILGVTVVLTLATVGARGILEGYRRFRPLSVLRMTLGCAQFIGAALVLPFSSSLAVVIGVLAALRLLGLAAHLALLRSALAGEPVRVVFRPDDAAALVRFGGWLTLSNVVSPIMMYFDRFFVAAVLGMAAAAHYSTPGEVIARLSAAPEALMGVLYPALAATVHSSAERARALRDWGLKMVLFGMLPVAVVLSAFAYELLALWLGAAFAQDSAPILRILAAGLLANSIARVYNTTLQASARPDLAAKAHVAELPVFLIALWAAATGFGVEGVAWVWAGRTFVDLMALRWLANGIVGESRLARQTLATAAAGVAVMIVLGAIHALPVRLAVAVVAAGALAAWCWRTLLDADERAFVKQFARTAPR